MEYKARQIGKNIMTILCNQTLGGRSGTTGRRILSVSPQSRLADTKTNEGLFTGFRDLSPMETRS